MDAEYNSLIFIDIDCFPDGARVDVFDFLKFELFYDFGNERFIVFDFVVKPFALHL
jgi:hypothetical protein